MNKNSVTETPALLLKIILMFSSVNEDNIAPALFLVITIYCNILSL
jgi:hypothetical protein